MRFEKPSTLIMMVAMMVCLYAVEAWAAGPNIVFGQKVGNMGRVPRGQKVTVQFPFTNTGDRELVVQGVDADCGCTETYNESREVPPKGRSEIIAVLDTTGLSQGRHERQIHVRSNDERRPSVTLTLVVDVVP